MKKSEKYFDISKNSVTFAFGNGIRKSMLERIRCGMWGHLLRIYQG